MKFFNFCFPKLATPAYISTNNVSETGGDIYTLEDLVNILEQLSCYLEQSKML